MLTAIPMTSTAHYQHLSLIRSVMLCHSLCHAVSFIMSCCVRLRRLVGSQVEMARASLDWTLSVRSMTRYNGCETYLLLLQKCWAAW